MTAFVKPVVGQLFLRRGADVPDGPPDARAAWARETGDLCEVVAVFEREAGADVAYRVCGIWAGASYGVDLAEFEREWVPLG